MDDSPDLVHREHEGHSAAGSSSLPALTMESSTPSAVSGSIRTRSSSRSVLIDMPKNLLASWTPVPLAMSMVPPSAPASLAASITLPAAPLGTTAAMSL